LFLIDFFLSRQCIGGGDSHNGGGISGEQEWRGSGRRERRSGWRRGRARERRCSGRPTTSGDEELGGSVLVFFISSPSAGLKTDSKATDFAVSRRQKQMAKLGHRYRPLGWTRVHPLPSPSKTTDGEEPVCRLVFFVVFLSLDLSSARH